MDQVRPRYVAERPGLDPARDLAPLAFQAVLRFHLADGRVWSLDPTLALTTFRDVGLPAGAKLLNATPDLRHVIAEAGAVLIIEGPIQHELAIGHADRATFMGEHHLLVTAPVMYQVASGGRTIDARGEHHAYLVHVPTASILDRVRLDVDDALVLALSHPTDGSVLLDGAMGQDGNRVFAAQLTDGHLAVELVFENRCVGGFSSSGTRLLLTPHPSLDDEPEVVHWPTTRLVASIDADRAGLDDDAFDFCGTYVGDDHIVLQTFESGLLLLDVGLEPRGHLDLAEFEDSQDFEIESIAALGGGHLGVVVMSDRTPRTTVWNLDGV